MAMTAKNLPSKPRLSAPNSSNRFGPDNQEFYFQWIIPNYQAVLLAVEYGMSVDSSPFWYPPKHKNMAITMKSNLWQIKLYPYGNPYYKKDFGDPYYADLATFFPVPDSYYHNGGAPHPYGDSKDLSQKLAAIYIKAIPNEEEKSRTWERNEIEFSFRIAYRPFQVHQQLIPIIRNVTELRKKASFNQSNNLQGLNNCFSAKDLDVDKDSECDLIIDLIIHQKNIFDSLLQSYQNNITEQSTSLLSIKACRFCGHSPNNKESYVNSSKFSDVQFALEDPENPSQCQTFYAHKIILAQGSKYFACMLSDDRWKESKIPKITIRDVKPATFLRVLQWLYCNTFDYNGDTFMDILDLCQLADMYELESLVKLLTAQICRQMNRKNWHQALFFGHEKNFNIITEAAIKYAINIGPSILDEEGMLKVMNSGEGELIQKIMKGIAKKLTLHVSCK